MPEYLHRILPQDWVPKVEKETRCGRFFEPTPGFESSNGCGIETFMLIVRPLLGLTLWVRITDSVITVGFSVAVIVNEVIADLFGRLFILKTLEAS